MPAHASATARSEPTAGRRPGGGREPDPRATAILALQRTVGNRAVSRLLADRGTDPGTRRLQRLGDTARMPRGLACTVASSSAPPAVDNVVFPNAVSTLSSTQQTQLENFAANWQAAGANRPVRIDGFASTAGGDELNWRLACDRARAVAAALEHPPSGASGIPGSFIEVFTQGETSEFGSAAANRRVTLTFDTGSGTTPPPPVVGPQPPRTPPPVDYGRNAQVECVKRLGGCPNTRPAGIPTDAEIDEYNQICTAETGYAGRVAPTPEECASPQLRPPRPRDVTVLDWGENWNGFNVAGGLLTIGEIDVTGVRNMVNEIQDELDDPPEPECIRELTIIGHGAPGSISVGAGTGSSPGGYIGGGALDPRSSAYDPDMRAALAELTPLFCEGASVTLRGCNVGDGPLGAAFVQRLADLWHVRVRAHVGVIRGGGYWITGDWTSAAPADAGTPQP